MARVDFDAVQFCNQFGCGSIDPFTLLICDIRFLAVLWASLAVAAVVLDKKNGKRVLVALLVALALHFLISEAILKHGLLALVSPRLRPYLAHPRDIVPIGTLFRDSSFPSSHNATSAAVSVVFCAFYPQTWPLGAAFVAAMAFARMHNGMHYPTDVLSGIALGVVYGLMAIAVERRRHERAIAQQT